MGIVQRLHSPQNARSSIIRIGSRAICDDLIRHGMLDTKIGDPSPISKVKFQNDYLRGYLDGDGYIYRVKMKGTKNYRLSIGWCCSHREILYKFGEILVRENIIKRFTIVNRHIHYMLISGNIQAPRLMNWLCINEDFGLQRNATTSAISPDVPIRPSGVIFL